MYKKMWGGELLLLTKSIATLLFVFMTIALLYSGIILWNRRKEVEDYSRIIWAVLSWVSAFFTLMTIIRIWQETTAVDGAFFAPEHTFVPIIIQMTFFLYPIELVRPTIGRAKVYLSLFTPLLLLVLVGMCGGVEYTSIYTYADLWQHIGEFNVLLRLFALVVMLFYCFSLFLVPYDWRKSCVDKKLILFYSSCFCLMGLLNFCIQISHSYLFMLAHQVVWGTFFLSVSWFELKERLPIPKGVLKSEESAICDSVGDGLWSKIIVLFDDNEKWRDPNLSLSSLSDMLESNRTYIGEAFKRNVNMTFVEYITKRRID